MEGDHLTHCAYAVYRQYDINYNVKDTVVDGELEIGSYFCDRM